MTEADNLNEAQKAQLRYAKRMAGKLVDIYTDPRISDDHAAVVLALIQDPNTRKQVKNIALEMMTHRTWVEDYKNREVRFTSIPPAPKTRDVVIGVSKDIFKLNGKFPFLGLISAISVQEIAGLEPTLETSILATTLTGIEAVNQSRNHPDASIGRKALFQLGAFCTAFSPALALSIINNGIDTEEPIKTIGALSILAFGIFYSSRSIKKAIFPSPKIKEEESAPIEEDITEEQIPDTTEPATTAKRPLIRRLFRRGK